MTTLRDRILALARPPQALQETRLTARDLKTLALICGLAIAVRVYLALSPSLSHPDEVFQYLEQANRLIAGNGLIPWEYQVGTRNWLLPALLVLAVDPGRALYWVRFRGSVLAMRTVNADPDACGVWIYPGTVWFYTGGHYCPVRN